jgi:hypothetical protein
MKLNVLLQAAFLLLLSVCTAQAVLISDVGRNPFYQPPLQSVNDLRYMMQAAQEDIRAALYHAGYPELYEPMMTQFGQADIKRMDYRPGQTFMWMLSKDNGGYGTIRVVSDMVLEGAGRLPAYEFNVYNNGMRYVFAVPFVCGNLALKEIIPVKNIVPVTRRKADCFGFGKDCQTLRFIADLGYLHQTELSDHLLLRAGLALPLTDRLSLLTMLGGAPRLSGADDTDAFLVDFLLQYHLSRSFGSFIGLGLGGWIPADGDEDTNLDLIANIGARIAGEPDTFNTSLFLEARNDVDELDNLSDVIAVGAGLRFRF